MEQAYGGHYTLGAHQLMQPVLEDRLYAQAKPERDGYYIAAQAYPNAAYLIELGHPAFCEGRFVKAEQAVPVYLRSFL